MLKSLSDNCSIHDNVISIHGLSCDLVFKEITYKYEPANLYIYLYSNLLGRYYHGTCRFILFLPSVTLSIENTSALTEEEYACAAKELCSIFDKTPCHQYAFGEEVFDISDYNMSLVTPTGMVVMNNDNFEVFTQTPKSFEEYAEEYLRKYLGIKYTALQIEKLPNYFSYFIYNGAKRIGLLYFECILKDIQCYVHVKYREVLYETS